MSPRVRRQLTWLSLMLVLAVAALLAQGSACGSDQRTLARASASADCDLVTCPLRTAPAVARLAEEQCAACQAALRGQPDDNPHVHMAAVAEQPLERAWRGLVTSPEKLDERGVTYLADLLAHAPSARDDSAANRAPPSA